MGPLSIILNDVSKVHTREWIEAHNKREVQISLNNSIYLLEHERRAAEIERDIAQKTVDELDRKVSSLIDEIRNIKLTY